MTATACSICAQASAADRLVSLSDALAWMPGNQAAQSAKPAAAQAQASPQQSTGSVMMDLTDGNTRDTVLPQGATADFTLGGYTKAIEAGNHPVWGSQRTAQLDDTSAAHAGPASNGGAAATADFTSGGYTRALEQGSHPAWTSAATALLDAGATGQTNPAVEENAHPMLRSARPSRLGQSPLANKGIASLEGQSPLPVKGRVSLAGQSLAATKSRLSLPGQSPSVLKRVQPEGQRSKWGFVPGEDDTLDLNMEKAGE